MGTMKSALRMRQFPIEVLMFGFCTFIIGCGALEFIRSPGVVRLVSKAGVNATLEWITDAPPFSIDTVTFYNPQYNPSDPSEGLIFFSGNTTYGSGYDSSLVGYQDGGKQQTILLRYLSGYQHPTGNYTCVISSSSLGNILSREAVLYHYAEPLLPSITPTSPVEKGQDIVLVCTSQLTSQPSQYAPDPPLFYRWYRDGEDITDSPPDRHQVSGQQLQITDVQTTDGDVSYTCRAVENGGLQSDISPAVNIVVHYPPANISLMGGGPQETAVAGQPDPVTRSCEADCSPPCNYTWDGNYGNTLTFNPVTKEDHGTHICGATNSYDTVGLTVEFELTVNYSPEVQVTTNPFGDVYQGLKVTMTCDVDSRPPSSIVWSNSTGIAPLEFDEFRSNETHSWGSFDMVDILDSSWVACTANNDIGSPVVGQHYLNVVGPVRPDVMFPDHETSYLPLGVAVDFSVSIIANPLPTQDQWNWTFLAEQSPEGRYTDPGGVYLTVSKQTGVLSVAEVTSDHYGKYAINSRNIYGGWPDGTVEFILSAQMSPEEPQDVRVTQTTSVSILVQWTTGLSRGPQQNFSVVYSNPLTGERFDVTDIPDVGPPSGSVMEAKLTEGVTPESQYDIEVRATNAIGSTSSGTVTTVTPVKATLENNEPIIKIRDTVAEIHFEIIGPVTDIKIENCASQTTTCSIEIVTVPTPGNSGRYNSAEVTVSSTLEFTAVVQLADPSAEKFEFTFALYDGEDLLETTTQSASESNSASKNSIIIGLSVVLVIALAALAVFLFFFIQNKRKEKPETQDTSTTESPEEPKPVSDYYNVGAAKEVTRLSNAYELLEEMKKQPVDEATPYQSLSAPRMSTFDRDDITLKRLLSAHGGIFTVWSAVATGNQTLPNVFTAKQVSSAFVVSKRSQAVLWNFVVSQGEALLKLSRHDTILNCLGTSNDMLLLENAACGNLHQFLRSSNEDDVYMNSTTDVGNIPIMYFVQQVLDASQIIDTLGPPVLHYCLSAEHVLVFPKHRIKLYNFAGCRQVIAREKWEASNNLPRPYRWMAPETVSLNHCKKSDVWSLGVLIWEILNYGQTPYETTSEDDIASVVQKGHYPEETDTLDKVTISILQTCWRPTPSERPTFKQMHQKFRKIAEYEHVQV